MTVNELVPASKPTFYFVGVTTGKSSIMKVFPKWAAHLGLGDVEIKGIDCKWHDDPSVYLKVVDFIKADPLSVGALVTTHKMDLLEAARDRFGYLDPYAELLDEISSISKRKGKLRGHAMDPISSGYSFDAIVPPGYWKLGGELCILGAGGSSLALTCYLMKQKPKAEWPSRLVVTNRSPKRLEHMKQVHAAINPGIRMEYVLAETAEGNDAVVNGLKARSLVVNATGLGKDAAGSPLTDAARFPDGGLVWEYNYRGELVFVAQARAQEKARSLKIEDGWVYFIHGWTRVIAEVFGIDIPASGPAFDELCRIAAESR
ncbi:MAG: shikimate dehydrogenase [Rectinemataceae bacterium]|jgi:shikimate 5-dehydrogenase